MNFLDISRRGAGTVHSLGSLLMNISWVGKCTLKNVLGFHFQTQYQQQMNIFREKGMVYNIKLLTEALCVSLHISIFVHYEIASDYLW